MSYLKDTSQEWYNISNIQTIDSPALIVYKERVVQNIKLATGIVKNISLLRPHIKTHKMREVAQMQLQAGITKFKCATISEAEMLALAGAPDVLLAYQPVGPKIERFINLLKAYPNTHFSCLTDNTTSAKAIAEKASTHNMVIDVYIDLNTGMNRTGIPASKAMPLIDELRLLEGIRLVGLHAYDGHIRAIDLAARKKNSDEGFAPVAALQKQVQEKYRQSLNIVTSGTPTFPTHAVRENVECSPGTFVFSDWGYKHGIPDEPFEYAALVITRIISIVDKNTVCTDLGHKSVAAENPLPRVHFLNAPDVTPVGQSEEHLVLKVEDSSVFTPGDVLYGVPVHICPTVALYDKAYVVENNAVTTEWQVVARNRFINF
ncbi:MAG: D-TA family PLP-dependent enzyme [Chitinophagaceae bacterium]|nr:D-TA family PLP-dependent enzyme [Chitinophagaceae bacterium]